MFSSVSNPDGTRRILITTSGQVSIDLPVGMTFIQKKVGDSYCIFVKFQEDENNTEILIPSVIGPKEKTKRNYSPRLTVEQKEEIKRLIKEENNLKIYEIAKRVGATKAQVTYCLKTIV